MTIKEQVDKVRTGQLKAEDNLDNYLKNIMNKQHLNAFLSIFKDKSCEKARDIDKRIRSGESTGKLAGTIVACKDILNIEGTITTCASKILQNYKSPYSATVIKKLESEDAIIIGKTNLDEFAMGSTTENSYFGASKNPIDETRVPGGSSGGSAVAVAADLAQVAIGTDTGGSIRQPAAFTGIVGLKPSYGRVSRYGLIAFASSLDQIGHFAKSVEDAAYFLEIIAGYDNRDSTSVNKPAPDFTAVLDRDIKGLCVGIPEDYFGDGLAADIKNRIYSVVDQLEKNGAIMKKIELPNTQYAIATYYILATAEASSNLARYDGIRYGYRNKEQEDLNDMYKSSRDEGFGEEVKRRIMLGTYVLSAGYYDAYYKKAQQVRRLIKEDFDKAFKGVDCIITPTTPTTAYKVGEKIDDPLEMYLGDIFTVGANLAGICGMSVPVGNDSNNLPIGMQLMAASFQEDKLLQLGDYIERECSF